MFIWLHFAIGTAIIVATPALILLLAFNWRVVSTQPKGEIWYL